MFLKLHNRPQNSTQLQNGMLKYRSPCRQLLGFGADTSCVFATEAAALEAARELHGMAFSVSHTTVYVATIAGISFCKPLTRMIGIR